MKYNPIKRFFKEITIKKLIIMLIIAIAVMLISAGIDFLMHNLSSEYSVPSFYFPNKIIFGTIFFFIGLILFGRLHPANKAITTSLIVAILLQIKYFITGYSTDFVFIFLFIHFGAFLIPAWILLSIFKRYME
jgi:hypothetical protein